MSEQMVDETGPAEATEDSGRAEQRSRGEARRLALIAAAQESFLTHGYGETTLDMVIAKAGGSRRTLYEHFGSKEGLFAAVISQHSENICRYLNSFEAAEDSAGDVLRAFGRMLLRKFTAPNTMKMFRLVIGETNRFPEIGALVYRQGPRQGYERMITYLIEAHRTGRLAVPDPERSARRLLDLLRSDFYLRGLLSPDTVPSEAELSAHVDRVVDEFIKDHQP